MRSILLVGFLALSYSAVHAGDFPQFRGPGGTGVANEKNLPIVWSDDQNVRWKAPLPGRGLSQPVVVGKKLFVTACTGVDQDRLHVLCFDADTGKKLWHRQLTALGATVCHSKTNMAAPTPAADDKHVVALFSTFDLACFDHDGNLAWFRGLTGDYQTVGNNVGMASSPILWRDNVILAVENAGESFGIAIDKNTGQNKWKVDRPRKINWVTPLVTRNNNRDEVVFQSGDNLGGYDPASGKELWTITSQQFSTIPSPVAGGGLLFVPGPKFLAIRPGTDKADAEVVWEESLSTGYSSPLYHNGLLYTLATRGVLNCVDAATGKKKYSERVQGTFAASPLLADDKLYLTSEEGETTIIQAGPEAKVIGTNTLRDKFLASPVAANGALYLRSDEYLYCISNTK